MPACSRCSCSTVAAVEMSMCMVLLIEIVIGLFKLHTAYPQPRFFISQNQDEILTFFDKIDYNCDGSIDWVSVCIQYHSSLCF